MRATGLPFNNEQIAGNKLASAEVVRAGEVGRRCAPIGGEQPYPFGISSQILAVNTTPAVISYESRGAAGAWEDLGAPTGAGVGRWAKKVRQNARTTTLQHTWNERNMTCTIAFAWKRVDRRCSYDDKCRQTSPPRKDVLQKRIFRKWKKKCRCEMTR